MKTKVIFGLLAIVAVALLIGTSDKEADSESEIKIGVVTPLTGGAAYWGESSLVGIRLAEQELQEKGIPVRVIVEDGELDPKLALSGAQKLVNIDGIDAMYTEFNPAVIAVSSFLQDKDLIQICNATPVSPLALSENFFKTYLDYEESCEQVANVLQGRGHTKVGVLKMNLEHGDLCLKGIRNVFGDNVVVENYNTGIVDFRTPLAKLEASGVQVIFHAAFQAETLASLRNMRELGMSQPFVGLAETMTPGVAEEFEDVLEGAVVFGLPTVSPDLLARLNTVAVDEKLVDQNAAALAYLHITQLGEALSECKKETACVREKLKQSPANAGVGFQGFTDRIAGFDTLIQEWKDGQFVPVSE